ncbi:MAG: Yip1 family protein [Candidatus Micrarchaeota archaeon]|nr:Yip1 family protein [Candidatus Micrarchaeota archaeon]
MVGVSELYEQWKNTLMNPEKTLAGQKKKASLEEGVKQLAIALVVAGVISGIITTLYTLGLGVASIVIAPIAMLIGGLIGAVIVNALVWVVAKALEGKGSYGTQFHLVSLVYAPVLVLTSILNIIPVLGGLIGMLVSLYGLYLSILAVKEAHSFSIMRAAVAVLLPVIVIGVILAMLMAVLVVFAGLIGLGGLMAGAQAKTW